ncbi:MAG: ABC transporter permease [Rikenellaceae bacterium]|jgi:lipoprotein-releasing system permease protein|nr:ABC transporter permease [Rikenellaceae bacterium]
MRQGWLARFVAGRYLHSRRSHSVINLITGVSAVAVAVPVAAMIILLSVFNGFDGMIRTMFSHFDPDILISPARGKTFEPDSLLQTVNATQGVGQTSLFLDETALLVYGDRQFIATVRGVDSLFAQVIPIEAAVDLGEYMPWFGDMPRALVGRGVAYNLALNYTFEEPLRLFAPRRGGSFSSLLPLDNFRTGSLQASGVFTLDAQTDGEYIVVPLDFARRVFDYPCRVSGVMVRLAEGASVERTVATLQNSLGSDYTVKDRFQQKASLYRIMASEKWGIFFIVLMVLLISSCAVVGSLAMLIIDKRDDIATLSVMGAPAALVRRIFVAHAMLVSMLGAVGGLLLGLAVCYAQQRLGLVPMPAQSFLVRSYPVEVRLWDVALVAATFTTLNFLIIRLTASIMLRR